MADSVRVACEALAAARPARVTGVTFYGSALHEDLATARVVCRFFPEAAESLSSEAQHALAHGAG